MPPDIDAQQITPKELSLYYHSKFLPSIDSLSFNHSTDINILHHNSRSLNKRKMAYTTLDAINNTSIFCLSETFLKPYHSDTLCTLENFKIERCDRPPAYKKTSGGGAAILIRNNLHYKRLQGPTNTLKNVCDSVWIKLYTHNSKPLIIGSLYRPPDSDRTTFISLFNDAINSLSQYTADLVIMGDFNINWNSVSASKKQLYDTTLLLNLQQLISGPTYTSPEGRESTIDLAFISNSATCTGKGIAVSDLSDHYFTYCSLRVKPLKPPRKLINTRSYHKLDRKRFFDDATLVPFHQIPHISDSPHEQALSLENHILSLLDLHIPIKTLRVRNSKPSWLSSHLLKLIRLKNRFFRKVYKGTAEPTANHINQYKKFRNYVTRQLRCQKRETIQHQLAKDIPTFYKCARKLLGTNGTPSLPTQIIFNDNLLTDDKSISEAFNSYFSGIIAAHSTLAPLPNIPCPTSFSFHRVSCKEVQDALLSLKDKKGGISQTLASIYQLLCPLIIAP